MISRHLVITPPNCTTKYTSISFFPFVLQPQLCLFLSSTLLVHFFSSNSLVHPHLFLPFSFQFFSTSL